MKLSYISRTCAPACHPIQPPQKGLQRWPYAAATRGLRQPPHLPCCAQDFLPNLSCISRKLLSISRLAFLPVPPFSRRQKASSATCARPTRPHRRPSPATRLPSCAENFSAQSLVYSRTSLVRALLPVPPLQPPQKGFQRGPCPAPAATRTAFASHPLNLALADPILDRDRKMAGNLAE